MQTANESFLKRKIDAKFKERVWNHVDKKVLQERLQDYLNQKNLKSTKQRDIIFDTFCGLHGEHISIEDLLEQVRKVEPKIGYATVYRTLMLFVDAKIAAQRQFQEGQSLFELDTDDHHDHLICEKCNRIVEFENEEIENLQNDVAKNYNFTLTRHKMELYGICSNCHD